MENLSVTFLYKYVFFKCIAHCSRGWESKAKIARKFRASEGLVPIADTSYVPTAPSAPFYKATDLIYEDSTLLKAIPLNTVILAMKFPYINRVREDLRRPSLLKLTESQPWTS